MKLRKLPLLAALLIALFAPPAQAAWNTGLMAPLTMIAGRAYWGGTIFAYNVIDSIQLMEGSKFEAGIESGFYVGTSTSIVTTTSDNTSWLVPVLATARWTPKLDWFVKPFATVSVGVGITKGVSSLSGFTSVTTTSQRTSFYALGGVGAFLDEKDTYFISVRAGAIRSSFVFEPQIGVQFQL